MDIRVTATVDVTPRVEALVNRVLAAIGTSGRRPESGTAKATPGTKTGEAASSGSKIPPQGRWSAAAKAAPGTKTEEETGNKTGNKTGEAPLRKMSFEELKQYPGMPEIIEKFQPEPVEEERADRVEKKQSEPEADTPAAISDGELRAEMDAARVRLLGENPKKNPRYAELTGFIRNLTADTYGAGVPSKIAQDRRAAFINDLQQITELEDGTYGLPQEGKAPF